MPGRGSMFSISFQGPSMEASASTPAAASSLLLGILNCLSTLPSMKGRPWQRCVGSPSDRCASRRQRPAGCKTDSRVPSSNRSIRAMGRELSVAGGLQAAVRSSINKGYRQQELGPRFASQAHLSVSSLFPADHRPPIGTRQPVRSRHPGLTTHSGNGANGLIPSSRAGGHGANHGPAQAGTTVSWSMWGLSGYGPRFHAKTRESFRTIKLRSCSGRNPCGHRIGWRREFIRRAT